MTELFYEFHCRGYKYRTDTSATKIERLFLGTWVDAASRPWVRSRAIEWLRKRGLYVEPKSSPPAP